MTLGAVSETVEVQSTAPLLESSTSPVGQVFESKAVSDLPLRKRFGTARDSGLFNIFKPPQFALPNSRIGNPAAGVISFNRGNSAGHSV